MTTYSLDPVWYRSTGIFGYHRLWWLEHGDPGDPSFLMECEDGSIISADDMLPPARVVWSPCCTCGEDHPDDRAECEGCRGMDGEEDANG